MNFLSKVTVSVINYNNKKSIFKAIESVINQNYPSLELILIDNNSTDGTREEIDRRIAGWKEKRKEVIGKCFDWRKRGMERVGEDSLSSNFRFNDLFDIVYIRNSENIGFGAAHNQAIRMARGEFVLLLNSDAILAPSYIRNIIGLFEDQKTGSAQGKLLRYDFEKDRLVEKKENNKKFRMIDAVGLKMLKNRRIICAGQGQLDKGQFEEEREIFGVDGAAPVYRKKALEDVKIPLMKTCSAESGTQSSLFEYFDEDFFMYKEDVDLAWRLRLAGWKAMYTPKAVAYHGRGSGESAAEDYLDIIRERRKIGRKAKYFSFRNQRLMQIKNDFPSLLLAKHFSHFLAKEVGAWIYMAIFERFTWRVLRDLGRNIPLFLRKRKVVMDRKRVGAREMEKWFE